MKSQVQRKQTKPGLAQGMMQAKKSNLLFLFNLKTDPNETSNLVRKYPKVFKMMMKKVRRIMRSGEVQEPDIPNLKPKSLQTFWNGTVSPGWCWAGQTEEKGVFDKDQGSNHVSQNFLLLALRMNLFIYLLEHFLSLSLYQSILSLVYFSVVNPVYSSEEDKCCRKQNPWDDIDLFRLKVELLQPDQQIFLSIV